MSDEWVLGPSGEYTGAFGSGKSRGEVSMNSGLHVFTSMWCFLSFSFLFSCSFDSLYLLLCIGGSLDHYMQVTVAK